MKLARYLLVCCIFLGSFSAWSHAEEHPLSDIRGTSIDLKLYDHAIAGSIRDFVVFGYSRQDEFGSRLFLKKEGQIVEALFQKDEKAGIGGVIRHVSNAKVVQTAIRFIKLEHSSNSFHLDMNGKEVVVKIAYEDFSQNHFINPTYTAFVGGKAVGFFKLMNGQACYGLSLHLILMIFGSYFHGVL